MLAGRHYSETVSKCKNISTTDGKVKWILQVGGGKVCWRDQGRYWKEHLIDKYLKELLKMLTKAEKVDAHLSLKKFPAVFHEAQVLKGTKLSFHCCDHSWLSHCYSCLIKSKESWSSFVKVVFFFKFFTKKLQWWGIIPLVKILSYKPLEILTLHLYQNGDST